MGVVAPKDNRRRNLWLYVVTLTCKQCCILSVQNLGASGIAVGEAVCRFDGVVL